MGGGVGAGDALSAPPPTGVVSSWLLAWVSDNSAGVLAWVSDNSAALGGGAASAGRLIAQEWALLAAAGADDSADGAGAAAGGLASLDLKVLVQENLEQLAFLDNVDTDTQVMRPPSWTPA